MDTTFSTIKNVTELTSFGVARLYFEGKVREAFIDQDGDIVGLIARDAPYFPPGLSSDIHRAASKGLKLNAPYKAYSAEKYGEHSYMLNTAMEHSGELAEKSQLLKGAEKNYQDALDLYRRISGKEHSGGCIEGEFTRT